METEGGITQISLENLSELITKHGQVRLMYHYTPHGDPLEAYTDIHFQDGHIHKATGFSIGYRGEGPNGLVKACCKFLHRDDITIDIVNSWHSEGDINYMITNGQGNGQMMTLISGVMDCEYDIELW